MSEEKRKEAYQRGNAERSVWRGTSTSYVVKVERLKVCMDFLRCDYCRG